MCISHKRKFLKVLSSTLVHKAPETKRLNTAAVLSSLWGHSMRVLWFGSSSHKVKHLVTNWHY